MRSLFYSTVFSIVFAFATSAHAGDRGLYIHYIELPDANAPDAIRAPSDALLARMLRCETTPLAQCRAEHMQGTSDRYDTGRNVVLYDLPAAATPELIANAARGQRRSARALAPILSEAGVDGVIALQSERGRLFIVALFSDGTRAARVPVVIREGSDANAIWDRALLRAMRPILRRWVP